MPAVTAGALMLKFEKISKDRLETFAPYFAVQNTHIGDFSLGFQFMWNKALSPEYALSHGCLILRELYAGKTYFHYPLSLSGSEGDEGAAIAEIEAYCRDNDVRLHYTNVPREKLYRLIFSRSETLVTDIRRWRDYLYRAEDFQTYAGGKYAGQRNHVRKFMKNYPDWAFRAYEPSDEAAVIAFLHEYEAVQRKKGSRIADEEMNEVYELIPTIGKLGLLCGILTVGGKIAAISAGERCGDMIVVHIEKALREYEGIYPFVAQQFALRFCGEGVRYLNRMDDAGDIGLRKSKLQYGPCELVDKYNVIPKRAIDTVSRLPTIETARLTLAPVKDEDKEDYLRLASDVARSLLWGYDWREDYQGEGTPSADWFLSLARAEFAERREMPLGIYCGGKLVGETTLHRFGYSAEAEIGVRLLPEAEGNGYAAEAVRAYAEYAFVKLGAERIEAKCFHANERSKRTLTAAGLRRCGEDETYTYYYITPAM